MYRAGNGGDTSDTHGHGTHCAGIIAGRSFYSSTSHLNLSGFCLLKTEPTRRILQKVLTLS